MHEPLSPSLYQINQRVWLMELSRKLADTGEKAPLPIIAIPTN